MERWSRIVADTWPVIALLEDEPAAGRVARLISGPTVVVSWINLGEVLYISTRRHGAQAARRAVADLARAFSAEIPDEEMVIAAALVKAEHTISYADCFAVATAERHRAPLLTGDPDLLALDRPGLELIDVRSG